MWDLTGKWPLCRVATAKYLQWIRQVMKTPLNSSWIKMAEGGDRRQWHKDQKAHYIAWGILHQVQQPEVLHQRTRGRQWICVRATIQDANRQLSEYTGKMGCNLRWQKHGKNGCKYHCNLWPPTWHTCSHYWWMHLYLTLKCSCAHRNGPINVKDGTFVTRFSNTCVNWYKNVDVY